MQSYNLGNVCEDNSTSLTENWAFTVLERLFDSIDTKGYCCGSGRVRGCHGNHMKKSIIDEQTYSTLQKYFMSPDSKELLMMELQLQVDML